MQNNFLVCWNEALRNILRLCFASDFQVPGILTSLQRSVQSVLLGKMHHPDWLSQGIREKALIDLISLKKYDKGENMNLSIVTFHKIVFGLQFI